MQKAAIFVFFLFLSLPVVQSCLFVLPPNPYEDDDLFLPAQKALLIDRGSQQEIIFQAQHDGEYEEYALVIPVPSLPVINKTSANIFSELHDLTAPNVRYSVGTFSSGLLLPSYALLENQVTVESREQIGIYDISVLSSENATALQQWLTDNGYVLPEEAIPIIEEYVEKEWYFVAQKINLHPASNALIESLEQINSSISDLRTAQQVLSEMIAEGIVDKRKYKQMPELYTEITFESQETQEQQGRRDIYGNPPPSNLMSESKYLELFEAYNGYTYPHLLQETESAIEVNMYDRFDFPSKQDCKAAQYSLDDCDAYLWDDEDKEVNFIRNSELCGALCMDDPYFKEPYSTWLLADAITQATFRGDTRIQQHYRIRIPQKEEYYTDRDTYRIASRQARWVLQDMLKDSWTNVRYNRLEEFSIQIAGSVNLEVNSYEAAISTLAVKIINEIEKNTRYQDSIARSTNLLSAQEYEQLIQKHQGHGNYDALYVATRKHVDQVLSWKSLQTSNRLKKGTAQPIRITFDYKQIVYPWSLSQVSSGKNEVLLYVVSDHKVKPSNYDFKTEYAGALDKKLLRTNTWERRPNYPEAYPNLNEMGLQGEYITKLRTTIRADEMKDDVLFIKSDDNNPVQITVFEDRYFSKLLGSAVLTILSSLLFLLLFTPGRIFINRVIAKKTKITKKRHLAYSFVIPVSIFISAVLATFNIEIFASYIEQAIDASFNWLFESYELLRALRIPHALAILLSIVFGFTLLVGLLYSIEIACTNLLHKIKQFKE